MFYYVGMLMCCCSMFHSLIEENGYAARSVLHSGPTLDVASTQIKVDAYLRYAAYDKAMVRTCMRIVRS